MSKLGTSIEAGVAAAPGLPPRAGAGLQASASRKGHIS
jgi:hypothetical protein